MLNHKERRADILESGFMISAVSCDRVRIRVYGLRNGTPLVFIRNGIAQILRRIYGLNINLSFTLIASCNNKFFPTHCVCRVHPCCNIDLRLAAYAIISHTVAQYHLMITLQACVRIYNYK